MTVTVIRGTPAGHDPHGDPLETTSTSHELDGAVVAPRSTNSMTGRARHGTVTTQALYAKPGADVQAGDVIVDAAGRRWEIDGEIDVWESPFGSLADGVEIALRRSVG